MFFCINVQIIHEFTKMDLSGITPPRIKWAGSNLPEAWEHFQGHDELIFNGPLKEKAELRRKRVFFTNMGR